MWKVSVRTVAAHKLRIALTVLSVVLGTAFIAGALMFTNTLSQSYDDMVATEYDGVDVMVTGGGGQRGISATTRKVIAEDPKVSGVNVRDRDPVVLGNAEGESLKFRGNASLSLWYTPEDTVRQPEEILEGNNPSGQDEVILNEKAAKSLDIGVGTTLTVVDPKGRHEFTVVGIYDMALDSANTAALRMDESAYLDKFTEGNTAASLLVKAAEGVGAEELMAHINSVYGPDVSAETGAELAKQESSSIQSSLSFVNYFLVAFGLMALLVGTFLIANTFSMIVAQRTKEFALLRALGASRKQITRSVVLEAALIGAVGSLVGLFVGMLLVVGIKAVLFSSSRVLPDSGLGLSLSAILIPLLVGVAVTVISAWLPAQRAGNVRPVEAMRTTESTASASLRARTLLGAVMGSVGILLALVGALSEASTGMRVLLVGVGSLGVVVGYFLVGPALALPTVPWLGRVVGKPFGMVGRLAATNSARNPRRSATTAFALTLGVALVTSIGMFGATAKSAVSDSFEDNMRADFRLMGPPTGSFPVPREAVEAAAQTDGVGSLVETYLAPLKADGAWGVPFGDYTLVLSGKLNEITGNTAIEGDLDLSGEGFVASEKQAKTMGWSVGDAVTISSATNDKTVEAPLLGIYQEDNSFGSLLISKTTAEELIPSTEMMLQSVDAVSDGFVSHEDLRENLEESMKDYLVVQVLDAEDLAGEIQKAVNQVLNILYALLALAVIIAVLGIVNTLTLNVIERRQEIGMLRAVGVHRSQVRVMIVLEAVQVAVFGAVAGMLIGLGLGWAFLGILQEQGLGAAQVPWLQLLLMVAGSAVVGVLAALWPARYAAKTPPLDAIAE
ncbi:Macrolide export ATP-binding/permease protein MacB [Corynebacterium oculi]|uniref:Macrolide export ATP-binding/permease protein MacB n=1 Tax=Corynebacterium oculi TaxID=1544416 RepID=A0A0N8VZU5_9CORY|nr:FtsX-like permease family protein [Corynebacterium oculi]KQB84874.1 Macrolide export ATP-binding/permease protein MacB [Corynebacterium oculi]